MMSQSADPPESVEMNTDVATASNRPGARRRRAQAPAADPFAATPSAAAAEPIRALTATIESLSAQLAGKDQAIRQWMAQVAERDARIQDLQQQLQARTAERDGLVQELRQQLQEALASRDALLAANDPRVAELAAMVQLRDQNITAREWETAGLRSDIAALRRLVAELEARIADIYASRTWLLSKKLWSARTSMRKLIR